MLDAVTATYKGAGNFALDEHLDLSEGQRVIITVISDKFAHQKKHIDLRKYAGSAGRMFGSTEEIDQYVKGLRENDRI